MKYLPAAIDAESARAKVERGAFFRADAIVGKLLPGFRASLPPIRSLPYLELAWMPQYLMRFALDGPRAPGPVCVSVDAYSSQFALFMAEHQVRDGDRLEGAFPPPDLIHDRAEALAREGLLKWVLRHHRSRKMSVGALLHAELLRYPFWVYYYQRRRGLLDIRIVDAVTGGQPGPKMKYAVVRAFQRASEIAGKEEQK